LFFRIDETIPGKLPILGFLLCILIQAGRTKAAVIEIFNLHQLIQRQKHLIAPALAGFTAAEMLSAPRAH